MYVVSSSDNAQLVSVGEGDLADHPGDRDRGVQHHEEQGDRVGELEKLFQSIFTALAANDVSAAGEGLSALHSTLAPVSGMERRGKKGGVKYKADYILNAVLLADNVRPVPVDETDFLTTVVKQSEPQFIFSSSHPRSMSAVMQPSLVEHICSQGIRLPKRTCLYNFRLLVDFSSMLWSREYFFPSPNTGWVTHFRVDSSPQFNRNYLVGEIDKLSMESVKAPLMHEALDFDSVSLVTRLCPLQILGRQATSISFKAHSCLRMLALEADPETAREAVRSFLSDMGVESGLWRLPDLETGAGLSFSRSMPLADMDHQLHHTMLDGEEGFRMNNELFVQMDQQLNALSKAFSKADVIERYIDVNINKNKRIPEELKGGLRSMFSRACPTYVKTRWHYSFDVMHWVGRRQQMIDFLEPAAVTGGKERSDGLTEAEEKAFRHLADSKERDRFWACFWCYYPLQEWGFRVQMYSHECPCKLLHSEEEVARKQPCKWQGRKLIEMASGACTTFKQELESLSPDGSQLATQAFARLNCPETIAKLRQSFQLAKQRMLLRWSQTTSFYEQFPWNIVRLLLYITKPLCERGTAIAMSKQFAQTLVNSFEAGELPDTFANVFFQGHLGNELRRWCDPSTEVMDDQLFSQLLSYGLALTVMQRLESRHHLVSQKVVVGRANSALAVSAYLRRKQNCDWKHESFKTNFARYLTELHRLVPEPWHSMAELHRLVSGHWLELMFRDTAREDQLIKQQTTARPSSGQVLEYQEHLKACLKEGFFYALPASAPGESVDGSTLYDFVQVISFNPAAKRYMQRVVGWSPDDWHERVAIMRLGSHVVHPATLDLDARADAICPLPLDYSAALRPGCLEAVHTSRFFVTDFEHIYLFKGVVASSDFDETILDTDGLESAGAASDLAISDLQLMQLECFERSVFLSLGFRDSSKFVCRDD